MDGYLIGVSNEERPLAGAVVVQHVHDLHGRVGLSGSRRPHHHGEPRLRPRLDGFHLP